jgi:hypothetical protein
MEPDCWVFYFDLIAESENGVDGVGGDEGVEFWVVGCI